MQIKHKLRNKELIHEIIEGNPKLDDDKEALCPDCGEATMESKEGGYQTCTACDWAEEDVDDLLDLDELVEKGVITKPEETDELIRLPAKGEEGKHKGHKIRWITVSAEKGIRGIYCITCKKIITYVFEKAKGWTMAKAKKWMKDNGKQVQATVEMCIVREADSKEALDEDLLATMLDLDYENRKVADALNDEDITKEEPKQTDREQGIMKELFDRTTEQLNRVEEELKSLKEGRVLSAKNRKLIQDALVGMEAAIPPLKTLLVATEPPQREEFELEVDKVDNKGKDVKDDPDMVDVDPDKLTGIIQEALKNNIDKIGEEIEKKIAKAKGKVG